MPFRSSAPSHICRFFRDSNLMLPSSHAPTDIIPTLPVVTPTRPPGTGISAATPCPSIANRRLAVVSGISPWYAIDHPASRNAATLKNSRREPTRLRYGARTSTEYVSFRAPATATLVHARSSAILTPGTYPAACAHNQPLTETLRGPSSRTGFSAPTAATRRKPIARGVNSWYAIDELQSRKAATLKHSRRHRPTDLRIATACPSERSEESPSIATGRKATRRRAVF